MTKFSEILGNHVDIAETNNMPYLRVALADAQNGAAGSIYKRATEDVDFFAMTHCNASENDLGDDFTYGLAGHTEEGEPILLRAEDNDEHTYLKGKDRRLVTVALDEEKAARFEPDGYEMIDMNAIAEFDEKNARLYEENKYLTRRFSILADNLHLFLEQITAPPQDKKLRTIELNTWIQTGLVHFQPFQAHNPSSNEWVCVLTKPDLMVDYYVASVPVVRDGAKVFENYEVDMVRSRQESDELPEDDDFADFPNGIPMYGRSYVTLERNEFDMLVEVKRMVVLRPFQRGLRVAAQSLGDSGLRLPNKEKHFRPVSVTAAKSTHIRPEHTSLIPFVPNRETAALDTIPFTLGVDDIVRLTKLFAPEEVVDVSYLSILDREDATLPVRFESYKELDTKDEEGKPHFIRKVACVAAVRALINGKVVVQ